MSKIFDSIVADAAAKSSALIEALPPKGVIHRANAERVVIVCRDFVSATPALDPVSREISKIGRSRYGSFPAPQSLLNRHRDILRIWRKAYRSIVDARAPTPSRKRGALAIAEEDLAGLDVGTKAKIAILQSMLQEQKRENDRLKQIIREDIPAPGGEGALSTGSGLSSANVEKLRNWLATVERGANGLELDTAGVRISRRARPRQVVMGHEILEALKRACAPTHSAGKNGTSIAEPKDAVTIGPEGQASDLPRLPPRK